MSRVSITIALALTLIPLIVSRSFADVATPSAGDSFQVESAAHAGQLLRVKDANGADGTPLVLYPQQAWRCMTWELQADGDGFRLKNHFTRKTVGPTTAPARGSDDSSVPVRQRPLAKAPEANEAWRFVPIEGKPGLYRITHIETGLVLDSRDDGQVIANRPSDSPTQEWRLLPKPEHFTG